jgi:hypothetical protein
MAKVTGGTDGSISGAIGAVVFYKMRGKSYARKAPGDRAKNSWSEGQRTYFTKFGKAAAYWRQLTPQEIKAIFDLAAENMTGYNLFLKTNLPAFSADGSQIDFEYMHLSAGKLPLPHHLKAQKATNDPEKVEVTWTDDSDKVLASTRDVLMMTVVRDGKFTAPIATGVFRKQQSAVIQLPAGTGTVQGIYLSFASKERNLYSPDQWFGI